MVCGGLVSQPWDAPTAADAGSLCPGISRSLTMSSTVTATPDTGARQSLFVAHWLPVMEKRFAYSFRRFTPDARAEAIADSTASAWQTFQRAGDRAWDGSSGDRSGLVTPTRVADYIAANYTNEGREFLGSSILDVCAAGTRKAGRTYRHSLVGDRLAPLHGDELGSQPVALVTSESSGPATRFRIKHDWSIIAAHCKPKARRVLTLLAQGWKPIEIARRHLAVSPARVTALKYEIAQVASDLGYGPRRWQVA